MMTFLTGEIFGPVRGDGQHIDDSALCLNKLCGEEGHLTPR